MKIIGQFKIANISSVLGQAEGKQFCFLRSQQYMVFPAVVHGEFKQILQLVELIRDKKAVISLTNSCYLDTMNV